MTKSELIPVVNIQSTPTARKFLKAHLDARLNLPVATRPCVIFPAPNEGIFMERLFRGLLACITDSFVLHVWDIRRPDPTLPPNKLLWMVHPDIIDVVIEPDYNLLVILSYPGYVHQIIAVILHDLKLVHIQWRHRSGQSSGLGLPRHTNTPLGILSSDNS